MASDLEDDATCGSDVDRRLSDLRKEVATFPVYAGCLSAELAIPAFLSATEPCPHFDSFVTIHHVHIKAGNSFEVNLIN